MGNYMLDGTMGIGSWRLVAAATALAALSACSGGPYLADDGWRKAVPGLSIGAPATEAPAPTPVDNSTEDGHDETLVSAQAASSCTVLRLAGGDGNAVPTDEELRAAFTCIHAALTPAFGASGHVLVRNFAGWTRVTSTPFASAALGGRHGVVFANARALGTESSDEHFDRGFPVGATLAVATFGVAEDGGVEGGPLILVEKMEPGFFALQGNWRYTIVEPDGQVAAVTRGVNDADVPVCADCTHSQADLFYASLLNNGMAPYADGAGPAFPSVDTYGISGGLTAPKPEDKTISDITVMPVEGEVLDPNAPVLLDPNAPVFDPNAPVFDPNAPVFDPNAPILDPNAPNTDG